MDAEERKMRLMEMAVHLTAAALSKSAHPIDLGGGASASQTKKLVRGIYADLDAIWREIDQSGPA